MLITSWRVVAYTEVSRRNFRIDGHTGGQPVIQAEFVELSKASLLLSACAGFGDGEFAVGAMGNYGLTRFKMQLCAVELD